MLDKNRELSLFSLARTLKSQTHKNYTQLKGKLDKLFFFKVGVERVRKKQEIRKCSLSLTKLRTWDIKLI
jgi:hypothetical protein